MDGLLRRALTSAVESRRVRADVDVDVLITYCRHALGAAAELSAEGVDRLLELTLAALRPDSAGSESSRGATAYVSRPDVRHVDHPCVDKGRHV